MASYSAIQAAWNQYRGDKIKMGQWVDENRVSDQDLADALGYSPDEVKAWLSEADRQRRTESEASSFGGKLRDAGSLAKDVSAEDLAAAKLKGGIGGELFDENGNPRFGPGGTSLNLGSEPALRADWMKNGLSAEDFYKQALGSNQGYTVDPKTGVLMSSAGNAPWAVDQFGPEPEGYGKTETQIPLANGNAGNIVNGKLVDTGRAYTAKEDFMTKYGVTLTGLALGGIAAGAGAGAGGVADASWGVNAAGDYSLAELGNIAGSGSGATGLTAASLAEAGVPLDIIKQGASAISQFLKDNKDTISLIGTGAGLAGIAGSLLSGDNKTTTTTTTKGDGGGGGGGDGSVAGVAKSDVDDAIKRLIQTQIDAINRNQSNSTSLSKSLQDQIAGLSKYYGNAQSKYDPSKNVLSAGGGGTGGTSYVGGAGLSEKASAALEEIMGIQLANLKNAGKLTPEQSAMIDANTGLALQTGQSDIAKFTKDTLRQINEEISQASGLRPTDTPIVRLSERAGEEASRQQGQLVRTLAGANVQSKLDYPLKSSANTGALAASASSTNEALRSFQADLEQRAENNRYRLFGQPMQDPYANNAAGNLGLSLAQLQLGQAPTTQTQTQSLGLNDYVNAASGIGALIKSLYLMNP